MVNLQQTINQGLSIAGLLYSQTAGFKANQEKRELEKQSKNTNKAGKAIQSQIKEEADNILNLSAHLDKYAEEALLKKVEVLTNISNKKTDILEKQAEAGDIEAYNKLTDPSRIKAMDELKNMPENIKKMYKNARNNQVSKVAEATDKAKDSLLAAQNEKTQAKVNKIVKDNSVYLPKKKEKEINKLIGDNK